MTLIVVGEIKDPTRFSALVACDGCDAANIGHVATILFRTPSTPTGNQPATDRVFYVCGDECAREIKRSYPDVAAWSTMPLGVFFAHIMLNSQLDLAGEAIRMIDERFPNRPTAGPPALRVVR